MKPRFFFMAKLDVYRNSTAPVKTALESMGYECSWEFSGQEVLVASDAGDDAECKLKVCLGHGLGGKAIYYGTMCVLPEREQKFVQLVSSKWYAKRVAKMGLKAEVVGCPRLDAACNTPPPAEPTLAYLPTCHPEISSITHINDRLKYIDNVKLIHRLHPHLPSEIAGSDSIYGPSDPRDGADVAAAASIVVCDYGTSLLDGIAINRPTIVYEPSVYRASRYFSPFNPEVVFSSCCYVERHWLDIKRRIYSILEGKDPLKERRERAAAAVCEHRGCAAQAAADKILELWRGV